MTTTPEFSLARRLRAGETVYSGWCTMGVPLIAEITARDGFSAVTLDMQHGLWDLAGMVSAVGGIRHGGAAPIVRPPLDDFATASRALDFGAEGIIAPMINSAADARAFVAATNFPPRGERSWGPHRALMLTGIEAQDYLRRANEFTVTLAMIETRKALEAVDAIAAIDGIDALFVGPSDLSIALADGAAQNPMSPDVERALDTIAAAAAKAGKIAGAYCHSAERAVALAKRGYRFLAVGSDMGTLRVGNAAQMKVLRGA